MFYIFIVAYKCLMILSNSYADGNVIEYSRKAYKLPSSSLKQCNKIERKSMSFQFDFKCESHFLA